jgi:ubiquinone/menaquinone biosynthesis C-methylase UbiE
MCNSRLQQIGKEPNSVKVDALSTPFPHQSFDAVVAIGSLHHTGDFGKAISEMARIVKPSGVVCGMVYSIRQFHRRGSSFPTKRIQIHTTYKKPYATQIQSAANKVRFES